MRRSVIITLLVLCFTFSLTASAADADMIFVLTGYPGTTKQAQGHIDRFLRHAEKVLGWKQGSSSGAYYSDPVEGPKHLKSDSPGMAVVTPDIYLKYRKSLKMKIVAKVRAASRGEEQYSVVVKKGTAKSLVDLKGKKVAGMILSDPVFVSSIVFSGKLAASDVEIIHEPRPLSGLRAVNRGKVDAAVVDQAVVKHMKTLSFGADLEVIHTSVKLPPPVVVSFPSGRKNVSNFKSRMSELCGSGEGKEICTSIQLSSIDKASEKDYASIISLYEGK